MEEQIIQKQKEQKKETLENGAYEVIKNRLTKHGNVLKERLEKLNDSRKNTFGSIETNLIGNERIITENNCIPRDMAPVGSAFLFGYNVQMGLKSKVELSDVFSIYEYNKNTFKKISLDLIQDKQFINDFDELYKYYKNTFFTKFTVIEPHLYMIFQRGKSATDIKAFKWLIDNDKLTYIDNRSDHEVKFSTGQEFHWNRVKREDQRNGLHPHISIEDKVFVETIGGDLTIKIEDNTQSGNGIYSEPVEDKDQTLDDAEIYYTGFGHLIILKIRPYKEKEFRYFVFNDKLKNVVRIDDIKEACVALPDNHGLIFPKGYYLQSGEYKLFDVDSQNFIFEQKIDSTNGEDFQYFFYNIEDGMYLIYLYNLIEQSIEMPILCSGYSHFTNGEMLVFKHEDEPRKNHMIQIWQTPYVGKDYVGEINSDSILYKIGNKEIVKAMADCRAVYNLIKKGESYSSIYVDIVKESERIMDSYFWLENGEALNLKEILKNIKETSASAIAEFEKVTRIKNSTEKQISETREKTEKLLKDIEFGTFDNIDVYVKVLADLRIIRGEVVSLKDLRYTNLALVDSLEEKIKVKTESFTQKCVEFLLQPDGLNSYVERVNDHQQKIEKVNKSSVGKELEKEILQTSADLELLIDIVSNFKIEDPTKTTEIIDNISSIFSRLNQTKSMLKGQMEELARSEGTAEFNSQIKLLNQAVVNYLDVANTIEKCEEYQNKVMVQIEELEGKFADFDEYILKLSEKREELYSAFETRKQTLLEKQNKKLAALFNSAQRILKGVANRLKAFNTVQEINGYFAGDIMIEKVRDIIEELISLGDTVKADEVEAKLKTSREEAVRQLKDKQDLFVGGKNVIKFGKHSFYVNTQKLDLSIVQKDEELYFHISGTDFWDRVESDRLSEFKYLWDQEVLSENSHVYRAEYLAYKIFQEASRSENTSLEEIYNYSDERLLEFIQKFMEPRYQEAYTKGIHDIDCLKLLKALIQLHKSIDLLVYNQEARAMAQLFWNKFENTKLKDMFSIRLKELNKISAYFSTKPRLDDYIPSIVKEMENVFSNTSFLNRTLIPEAAEYLCKEIMRDDNFVISLEAEEVYIKFTEYLKTKNAFVHFEESIKAIHKDTEGLFYLVREWMLAFYKEADVTYGYEVLEEVIIMLMLKNYDSSKVIRTKRKTNVTGMCGNHPVIKDKEYNLSYIEFIKKLNEYDKKLVHDFIEFQNLKKKLIQDCKAKLKLDEFKTNILSSFVRNKLIDKVYLPLIGDNLAKQIGAAGQDKRTDLMGMLLLISPPGYGKTTLMEYVADRLGITLIKINGPAIGHEVVSLDSANAHNVSAKEELRKLNLALKMGNNVMIYVDDIQHCNPEFLQKFISLCDGQRKIEGVYNGVGQTYDLRGKKVAVVMAGNPYTESGSKFQIPDMLANRADVYNLGDMLRENEEAFMLSYIENSLTSNPIMNKLVAKSRKDIYNIIDIAVNGVREGLDFEGNYSAEEINEFVSVIKKLFKVRDVVLKINMEYIRSAATSDEYRKEPPFKLQGSYRNMNKIAEKIMPVMNESEIDELISGAYENDAQTLTSGAEANMLKWKEIVECINETETLRWQEIKEIYNKNKLVKGDDKIGQAVLKLSDLNQTLEFIRDVLAKGS